MRSIQGWAGGVAAALLLLCLGQAVAQDQPPGTADTPFDAAAFDAATGAAAPGTAAPGVAEAARTEYLVGGSVLVSASGFFPSSLDGYAVSASASGKLFGKVAVPDYGALYMSYTLSQAFLESRGGTGSAALAPPLDLGAPSLALGELYYSFDIGKALFVRLGKQLLAWGPSRIWTPVDYVNSQRENFFSSVDLRQGEPGLKLFAPMGKVNATLFADFADLVAGSVTTAGLENTRLAGRLDAAVGGFELGITAFASAKNQDKAGFDFSGDLLGSAVYGELSLAPAYSSYSSSFSTSLGASRVLGDLKRWTLSAEGFYQSTGADYTGDLSAMMSLSPLYMGRYYGYLSLSADELLSQYLRTTAYGLANFSDLSYSLSLKEDFSFPRSVPFSVVLSFAGGGSGKEFTFAGGNDSLSITAQTLIEF